MESRESDSTGRVLSIGNRISTILAGFFLVAAVVIVVLVNLDMKQLALENAKSETRHFLDHNLAIHTYYTHQLKPAIFALQEDYRAEDRFDPTWMSSTYAVREITKYTKELNKAQYYYKECAINARSPENEADDYEGRFIRELNSSPDVLEQSEVRVIEGDRYLVTLRRGEVMDESCLRCHATPEEAPAGLVDVYGSERSFGRHAGEVVSAISVRIPLSVAYKHADRFSIVLCGWLLVLLLLLFVAQYLLSRKMMYTPLAAIHGKAVAISQDTEHLGEQVPVPPSGELKDLATAFNVMSNNLLAEHQQLEQRVADRTVELTQTNQALEEEIRERKSIEYDLLNSRSISNALINASLDTAILLAPNGEVLSINTIGAKRLGRKPSELIGRVIFDVLDSDVADRRQQVIRQVIDTGVWKQMEDARAGRNYETSVYPIKAEDGTVSQVAIFARDITENKKAEETLLEVQRREAEIAAIQLTAATSAHEINNPLMGITGSLQLLKESTGDPDGREIIKDALVAAQRIREVIKKLEQVKDPQYKPYMKDKQILDLE